MEKKRVSLLLVITAAVLFVLFGLVLFFLSDRGYLSFEDKSNTDCPSEKANTIEVEEIFDDVVVSDEKTDDSNNSSTKNDNTSSSSDTAINYAVASTNMTYDEVFDFWNKIKGNWVRMQIDTDHDLCVGNSLEINTYVKLAKFNSDGIITYGIISFNKLNDTTVELKLIDVVNLNNQIHGSISASYTTIAIDTGVAGDNKINVKRGTGDWVEYEYVGENKTIVNEDTHYYYVDGGFTQDQYCEWYKKNH